MVLVVGVSAGLSSTEETNKDLEIPSQSSPIEMIAPMQNAEVLKWYSDTELFYNETLKQWESHKAVDISSQTSNNVVAVLSGTVTDLGYSYEDGYTIEITHEDGLVTKYCSLLNTDEVKEGQKVNQGDKIGEVSDTASDEHADGKHLHFSILLNGVAVDPSAYLTLENK